MHSSPFPRWLPAVAIYAVILGVSAVPGSALEGTPGWVAVLGHATGYAALGAAVHYAWGGPGATLGAALGAIVMTVVLGVVNELQQGLVPGRSPEVADVAVDALGALVGVTVRLAGQRRRSRVTRGRPGSRPPGPGSAGQP